MMAETRAQIRISSVVSVHRALHARLYAKLSVSILHPAIYLFTVHIDCTVSVLDLYLFAWQLQERTACVHSGWCMCASYQIVPKKTYRLGQNSFACPHPHATCSRWMKKVTEMYFVNHTGVFPRGLAVSVRYSVVETVSHGALCAPLWVMREEREMMDKCPVLFWGTFRATFSALAWGSKASSLFFPTRDLF